MTTTPPTTVEFVGGDQLAAAADELVELGRRLHDTLTVDVVGGDAHRHAMEAVQALSGGWPRVRR